MFYIVEKDDKKGHLQVDGMFENLTIARRVCENTCQTGRKVFLLQSVDINQKDELVEKRATMPGMIIKNNEPFLI